MRSVRSECLSLAWVMALPVALMLAIPRDLLAPSGASAVKGPSFAAAFVELTESAERDALRRLNTFPDARLARARPARISLRVNELPPREADAGSTICWPALPRLSWTPAPEWPVFTPAQRAAPFAPLSAGPLAATQPAFAREELLQLTQRNYTR